MTKGRQEDEQDRHLHYPRTCPDQVAQKASHKGRQADDVRLVSCRESQASSPCVLHRGPRDPWVPYVRRGPGDLCVVHRVDATLTTTTAVFDVNGAPGAVGWLVGLQNL